MITVKRVGINYSIYNSKSLSVDAQKLDYGLRTGCFMKMRKGKKVRKGYEVDRSEGGWIY